MTERLTGKTIIVTGGGSGIGAGIGHGLAAEGANVVLADLNLEAAQGVADEIVAAGGSALATKVDITDRAAVAAGIQKAVETYGRLDAYFNNAGMNTPMKFLDITEQNFELMMKVNALGVLIGTQEAAKQFIAQGGGGKIINTTSMAGREGFPAFAPYSAAKSAVISLTQSAAKALAEHDVTVNAFAPGVVQTPLWVKLDADLVDIGEVEKGTSAMDEFASGIIRGRTAKVDDIVGTALYLASSDSDYLTAQVIMIDGGMVLV